MTVLYGLLTSLISAEGGFEYGGPIAVVAVFTILLIAFARFNRISIRKDDGADDTFSVITEKKVSAHAAAEVTDDAELVAVITAAITAAMEKESGVKPHAPFIIRKIYYK